MNERERLIEMLSKAFNVSDDNYGTPNIEQVADCLLEKGVIVPQCKVGDTVYYYHPQDGAEIVKVLVNEVSMTREGIRLTTFFEKSGNGRITYLYDSFFGKSLYHTYEEAKKAKEENENDRA